MDRSNGREGPSSGRQRPIPVDPMTVHPVETSIRDEVAERDAQERVAGGPADRPGDLRAAAPGAVRDHLLDAFATRRLVVDRRQVMVEFTDEGIRRVGELYGPLVAEGEPLLGSFSKEQLDVMRDQLVRMRDMTDRQRERLRAIDAG